MRISPTRFLLGFTLLLALAACSSPASAPTPPLSISDRAATIVAATMGVLSTARPPAAATPTAPPATPTTQPVLFIRADSANCRTGPGQNFAAIATFAAGSTVQMVGRDSVDSYWIVLDPTSRSLCWIQAQDGTPSGSFDVLPEYTPQAVSIAVPSKPANLRWGFNCLYDASGAMVVNVELGWTDLSNTANGFRIYRAGSPIANLPASATTFTDKVNVPANTPIIYGVEAYNDAGASPRAETPQSHTSAGDPIACNTP